MGKYTIFYTFANPRRGMQARNFTTNVPKILDLKSSSEQIFFRKLSLRRPLTLTKPYEKARSVASIYSHTPVCTAAIWQIFLYFFLKAFLSLNRDDG